MVVEGADEDTATHIPEITAGGKQAIEDRADAANLVVGLVRSVDDDVDTFTREHVAVSLRR